ncbi:MAG: hypothetical protein QME83_03535 [Thermodesulfobacteriota bacterium]|nr:hypothetical protein [Thermodesulfobacteriota bacterium]
MMTIKVVLLISFALFANLLYSDIVFTQTRGGGETISLSGIVKDVTWDHKSIVVGGKSFFISRDTKVIDQKGNRLKIDDIKKNADVAIDAIPHPTGFIIKEIVVITDRGV